MSKVVIVNTQRKIHVIQDEFNRLFPYLKVDFFLKPYRPDGLLRRVISPRKTIEECSPKQYRENMKITPGMTVDDLQQHVGEYYGIGVLVLRRSGKLWLETSYTSTWTLCRQNNEGETLTRVLEPGNENDKN